MNTAHLKLITERYENAVHEYTHAFCQKHGWQYDPEGWVGEDVGGVVEIADRYLGMDEIRHDITHNIEVGVFEEWYDYVTHLATIGLADKVNFNSWCMGYRPYTAEQIERIAEAHRRVREAQANLEQAINDHQHPF